MTSPPDPPAIAVRGAVKTYGEGARRAPALTGVDLDVARSSFVSVVGPSGSGKSTLLRLVAGLEEPDDGTVRICGRTTRQARRDKLVGFVPQVPALLPWADVLANVRVLEKVNRRAPGGGERDGGGMDAEALLGRLGLGEDLHKRPHQLSGGMQQRVAIARAFALRPQVLLMDEPFSALDEFTREVAQLQLLGLWEDLRTTVLFVTHSVREAVLLSDTVVVMAAPGEVRGRVDVTLGWPRSHDLVDSPAVLAHEHRVRQLLQDAFGAPGPAGEGA